MKESWFCNCSLDLQKEKKAEELVESDDKTDEDDDDDDELFEDAIGGDDEEEEEDDEGVDDVDHAVIKRVRKISEEDDPSPFRGRKGSRGRKKAAEMTEEEERYASKIHHLFVKVPPKRTAKFERMVRRNRTLEHEVKVYSELLRDLQDFVKARTGEIVQLKIPKLYHGGGEDDHQVGNV